MEPVVSVIMPVFNGELYVAQAAKSILLQTWSELELIAVDDGSSDGSWRVLSEVAASDARVRLIRQENLGQSKARMAGVEVAKGEYIALMDADDVALPHRIAEGVAFLRANADYVAVGGHIEAIDPTGGSIGVIRNPLWHDEIDRVLLSGGGAIANPSAMVRRDSILAVGGYRKQFDPAEDLDLWLRLSEHGKLANLDQIVTRYRMHPNSDSFRRASVQHQAAIAAVAEACERRGLSVRLQSNGVTGEVLVAGRYEFYVGLALSSGNFRAARTVSWLLVCAMPRRMRSWRTLIRAMVGPFRPSALQAVWSRTGTST